MNNAVLYIIIAVMAIAIGLLLAFRSHSIGINPVDNWRQIHKMASTWVAWLSGAMVGAIPLLDEIATEAPQFSTISYLDGITQSTAYKVLIALLLFIVLPLAKAWKQGKLTMGTAVQAMADASKELNPQATAPKQAGFISGPMVAIILSLAIVVSAFCLTSCATTSPSTAAKDTAYAAQTTADIAIKAIPSMLAAKTISKATATQINAAALDVNTAALAVYACTSAASTTTTCSTTALATALGALTALVPVPTVPAK